MTAVVKKSLLIFDRHPIYRDALSEKFTRQFIEDYIEVEVASSAKEGLDLIRKTKRSWVILLDPCAQGLSGIAEIKVFKAFSNVQHVVVISGMDESVWGPKTVAAGATMFLSKNSTAELILSKIKLLLELDVPDTFFSQRVESREFRLTQRQLEVLGLISLGHPNKVIADQLEISQQTVKIHINLMFKELRVSNRTQALLKAQQAQLL